MSRQNIPTFGAELRGLEGFLVYDQAVYVVRTTPPSHPPPRSEENLASLSTPPSTEVPLL